MQLAKRSSISMEQSHRSTATWRTLLGRLEDLVVWRAGVNKKAESMTDHSPPQASIFNIPKVARALLPVPVVPGVTGIIGVSCVKAEPGPAHI